MMKHLGYSLIGLLSLASCQREADDVEPAQTPAKAVALCPFASFVQNVQPDPAAAEFISGEFDGHFINCTTTLWANEDFYNKATDQVQCTRWNADTNIQLTVRANYVNLFTTPMPTSWPQNVATPIICQGFWLFLAYMPDHHSIEWDFDGATGAHIYSVMNNRMKFTVTSVEHNMVEGTFEGPLYLDGPLPRSQYIATYGELVNRPVTVKNGKFRVHVPTI